MTETPPGAVRTSGPADPVGYDHVLRAVRDAAAAVEGVALGVDEITEATPFWLTEGGAAPSLSFDSLDFLNLVAALEEAHGWAVPEEQMSTETLTVGDLARLIVDHAGTTA